MNAMAVGVHGLAYLVMMAVAAHALMILQSS